MLKPQSIDAYTLPTEINFSLAMKIRQEGENFIKHCTSSACEIDFSKIKHCKSVLISLILCWLRTAKKHNKKIVFLNVNQNIQRLISVCNLQDILNDPIKG